MDTRINHTHFNDHTHSHVIVTCMLIMLLRQTPYKVKWTFKVAASLMLLLYTKRLVWVSTIWLRLNCLGACKMLWILSVYIFKYLDLIVQCSMGNEHTVIDVLAYLGRPITHDPKEGLE